MLLSLTKMVENPVPNFAKSILQAEASGVLNVMMLRKEPGRWVASKHLTFKPASSENS